MDRRMKNMAWKRTVLADYDEKGIEDTQTIEIVKLPQAIISAIHLRLSGTGGTGTIAVDHLIATMKVKTDKGYICDMRSADARTLCRKKTGRGGIVTNATSAYSQTCHHIYFGRFPKDKALLLDLTQSNVRLMELTFGKLIDATAFAAGTVRLAITIDEWIGSMPAEHIGYLSEKEVEDKPSGTGKTIFELFSGNKLAGLLINIGTITTVRQITISDKKETMIFGKINFRDLLNIHNIEELNIDTLETLYGFWKLYDKDPKSLPALPLLTMPDPICAIERGGTSTTSRIVQIDLLS